METRLEEGNELPSTTSATAAAAHARKARLANGLVRSNGWRSARICAASTMCPTIHATNDAVWACARLPRHLPRPEIDLRGGSATGVDVHALRSDAPGP